VSVVLRTVDNSKGASRIGLSTWFQDHVGPKPIAEATDHEYVALRQPSSTSGFVISVKELIPHTFTLDYYCVCVCVCV